MEVEIPSDEVLLKGELLVPAQALGTVIFVHGSGSSRQSPRNQSVASHLNRIGFATLLFDLLTQDEELNRSNVFDIDLLSKRLIDVTHWVTDNPVLARLAKGFFGASTGAAAALVAAAELQHEISAVVARGGRVDLAGAFLEKVQTPTLMIVGAEDREVLELNYQAQRHMHCENKIEIIPGATHLFEELGALELVAELAGRWFVHHLRNA